MGPQSEGAARSFGEGLKLAGNEVLMIMEASARA
jgi:hypothetical protein